MAAKGDGGEDEALHIEVSQQEEIADSIEHIDTQNALLLDDVTRFATAHNLLHHLPTLQKAALLIQGETPPAHIPNITDHELQTLRNESDKKWRQPSTLYFTILVCSLGAVVQGWAQTGANGANLSFPLAFGIGSDSRRDNLIVGLINSGPYIATGLLGAWISDPINNMLGRRGTIFSGSILCLVAALGSALTQNWPQLMAFRVLLGIGLGLNASTVSVYAAECAPAAIRGGLAVSWQMWVAGGIFLGFVANAALYKYGASAWRWQFASAFIPTVPLLFLVYLCPESPSWYIKRNQRYDLAFQSLSRLRNTNLQAARELYTTYLQQQQQTKTTDHPPPSLPLKITQLLTTPRNRRATIAAYVVMLSQQLCGINIIAFYSSTIFSDAGFSPSAALLASCIFGLVNFLGAFPAIWTMDTLGRRSLLLLTLLPMALVMSAAGLSFTIPPSNPLHLVLLTIFIYLFCALYSPGMGPVPATYAAECFPLSHREVGMSMAVSTANLWAAALSLTFPRLLTALKPAGAFEVYAGGNVVAFVLVFLFVPETKRMTLEELDGVFEVPMETFVRFQVVEWGPWVLRRYLLGRKGEELKPLGVGGRGDYREVLGEEGDEGDD